MVVFGNKIRPIYQIEPYLMLKMQQQQKLRLQQF
jgi:hypothetical protein